jgi:hypothetical protein
MANYLLVYKGGSIPATEAEQNAVMAAWGAWFGGLGSAVVDQGAPIGPGKSVGGDGPLDVTGYSIISADSLDDAVRMADSCPILDNGSVDVYETVQM